MIIHFNKTTTITVKYNFTSTNQKKKKKKTGTGIQIFKNKISIRMRDEISNLFSLNIETYKIISALIDARW